MWPALLTTPQKDDNQLNNYDDRHGGSSSPLSFEPLEGNDSANMNISDVSSLCSFRHDDDDDDVEEFTHNLRRMHPCHSTESAFSDDDELGSSMQSHKTDETTETSASTVSFSHEAAQCLATTPINNQDDGERKSQHSSIVSLDSSIPRRTSDVGYFDDFVAEPVLILGVDISHLSPKLQFLVCASGVFGFNLMYGFLQELITVQICSRQLGLFLAMIQFTGYTIFSYLLQTYVYKKQQTYVYKKQQKKNVKHLTSAAKVTAPSSVVAVPFLMYLGLSLLRAVDLGMTNLAMQYINYPAKTLMKSSRVVFTMIFGVFIARKKYQVLDYFVVLCMVAGLAIFMHADATSSAIFQPLGVIMLTVSLLCDGAICNMSESIMSNYGVGQDEFIFRMYSIALVAITVAAAATGDLQLGLIWMMKPGTYDEMQQGVSAEEATWSVFGKISIIVLFSTMGFFGSSCSAAITKHYGALTMSITSTARKATTLFLSFFLFNNVCTPEHIAGVVVFITALLAKSLRRTKDLKKQSNEQAYKRSVSADLELQLRSDVKCGDLPGRSFGCRVGNPGTGSKAPRRGPRSPVPNYGTPGRRLHICKST